MQLTLGGEHFESDFLQKSNIRIITQILLGNTGWLHYLIQLIILFTCNNLTIIYLLLVFKLFNYLSIMTTSQINFQINKVTKFTAVFKTVKIILV